MAYGEWRPYVSVAQRRALARRTMHALREQGLEIQPIEVAGRAIATTFWGQAWCSHIESLGEYANRLPRGRTYVRNGSVCHLAIERGRVQAMVSGSELYTVDIEIDQLPAAKWTALSRRCSGRIGSLLELLQGRLSDSVMGVVTDPRDGLFPRPREIRLTCSCPDWAVLCKHVAAALYGVAARLDHRPELLFLLRGVDHEELVAVRADEAVARATRPGHRRRTVARDDLAGVFGIDLDAGDGLGGLHDAPSGPRSPRRRKATRKKKVAANATASPTKAKKKTKTKTKKKKTKSRARKKASRQGAAPDLVRKKAAAGSARRESGTKKRPATKATKKAVRTTNPKQGGARG